MSILSHPRFVQLSMSFVVLLFTVTLFGVFFASYWRVSSSTGMDASRIQKIRIDAREQPKP